METNNNNEIKKLPWAIKVLLFVAGMIASAFLSGFIFLAIGNIESLIIYLFIGIILLIANIAISKTHNNEIIIYSVGIPLYITGSILVGIGIGSANIDTSAYIFIICISLLLAAIVTYATICNNFIRHLCILEMFVLIPIMAISFNIKEINTLYLEIIGLFYILIFSATCIFQEKLNRFKNNLLAIRFSSLLCGLILMLYSSNIFYLFFYLAISIIIAVFIIRQSTGKYDIAAIILSIIVLSLASVDIKIIVSLICLMSAFYVKDKLHIIISLGYLAFGISNYYYNTTNTLLYKSCSLMAIGIVMILIYYYIAIQEKKNNNLKKSENE